MNALERLEKLVLQLSPDDLAKFRAWFVELDHQLWDEQIEADSAAGRFDPIVAEAKAEFNAGKMPTDMDSVVQRDVQEGLNDLKAGRVVGPFRKIEELKHHLATR